MEILVIMILWAIMSLLMIVQIAPFCDGLSARNKITVGIILLLTSPFLVISNIVEVLLSCILPEGWNDEDDDNSASP